MKRNELYRQCRLVKRIRGGEKLLMSYIPDEFARVGRVVKLKDDDGGWDDGWVIGLVGNARTEEQLVDDEAARRKFARETTKA